MILSHKHKFIFIKTIKTASTSIEIALSSICGEQDIITPIAPDCELIREDLGFRGPQNYREPGQVEGYVKDRGNIYFYNHMKAVDVRAIVGETIWDEYYTFCFERNPWDRAISLYYYNLPKLRPRPTVKDFILSDRLSEFLSNLGIYSMNGEVIVDHVARYEDLQHEMERIAKHLGFPCKLELPKAKSGYREDHRSYREILGERERATVAKACKQEIDLLGYKY